MRIQFFVSVFDEKKMKIYFALHFPTMVPFSHTVPSLCASMRKKITLLMLETYCVAFIHSAYTMPMLQPI